MLHKSMYLNSSLCVYGDSYKTNSLIFSGDVEHKTLVKSCHHEPKNRSTNSESTYIDRLRGVKQGQTQDFKLRGVGV